MPFLRRLRSSVFNSHSKSPTELIAQDDGVQSVASGDITADDQFLPAIDAVLDPRAAPLSWLIAAVFSGLTPPRDPKEAAQFGIKVVIIDVPRPQHGTFMPDVGPAKLPPSNGHKPQE
jgi:hypothetical protein